MRTVRCTSRLLGGGLPSVVGGLTLYVLGVYLPHGIVRRQTALWQNDRHVQKNINFPQFGLRGSNKCIKPIILYNIPCISSTNWWQDILNQCFVQKFINHVACMYKTKLDLYENVAFIYESPLGSVCTTCQRILSDDTSDTAQNRLQCFRSVRLHQASIVFNENSS